MTRFSGKVGFGLQTETVPGVWSDSITERVYKGSIIKETQTQVSSDNVNDDVRLEERISIVGDAYAFDNFLNIKYVERAGYLWKVTAADLQVPRLILSIGGVYNGELPGPTP
jgi:hypothetical protein